MPGRKTGNPLPAWQNKIWRQAKLPVRERTTRRMPGRKTGRRFPAWQNKIWRQAKLPVRERTTRRMPGRKTGNPFPAWQNKIWRPPNCQFVNARHGGCRVARRAKACRGCRVARRATPSLRGRARFGARPNCQFVNARHGGCWVGKQTKARVFVQASGRRNSTTDRLRRTGFHLSLPCRGWVIRISSPMQAFCELFLSLPCRGWVIRLPLNKVLNQY